jgi:hypothetical protein
VRSVIGLEGFVPANAAVVWGAAAIRDGEALVNTHTKIRAPFTEAARLAAEKHLHLFDPIDLREEYEDLPLVVVMVNRDSDKRDRFLIDTGKIGGLVEHLTRERSTVMHETLAMKSLRASSILMHHDRTPIETSFDMR